MSTKAARGTKRLCGGCGGKFYDLNNEPIICPLCEVEFKIPKPAADKDAKIKEEKEAEAKKAREAAEKKKPKAAEGDADPDVAAVDDEDLADIEEADDSDDEDDSTDAFLPDEDEGKDDLAEIVGDNKPKVEEES